MNIPYEKSPRQFKLWGVLMHNAWDRTGQNQRDVAMTWATDQEMMSTATCASLSCTQDTIGDMAATTAEPTY